MTDNHKQDTLLVVSEESYGVGKKGFGALLLLVSIQINASPIDCGGELIFDTDLDVTWLQDANFSF